MWSRVCDIISHAQGETYHISKKFVIRQTDKVRCLCISNGHTPFFIKIAERDHQEQFQAEVDNLKHLQLSQVVNTPEVIAVENSSAMSFIVLQYFAFEPAARLGWQRAAQQLANCHQYGEQSMFGWDQDNFIGATLQPNRWQSNWSSFFSEQRIGWQLELNAEAGTYFPGIDKIIESVRQQLHHHKVTPSLLHGDLWRGNIGFCGQQSYFFDPACYWGDRETDIAMTQLFEPFEACFLQTYQHQYPLPQDFQARQDIYQLYHLLNHNLLFGGCYFEQCQQYIRRILSP
ncbi:fructosamine kinase family protein [Motilimonas pumila]|uniref:Fructosamine kinase family protein n=1 Tax=Motilimonas pumila TaxID=2303987 RepID=A0A418YD44_9GAMM|nr:fructosamine kinase family protein [Motilimonas pumila]RJG42399.1 fructosamine kinase family protein [Motilimonas pumila]